MGPPPKRAKLDEEGLVVDANDVLRFHFANPSRTDDLVDVCDPFAPGMTHQAFGDEESIAGYSGLSIDVWLDPRTYAPLLQIEYSEKQEPADDISASLSEWFDGLSNDGAAFLSAMAAAPPLDPSRLGACVHTAAAAHAPAVAAAADMAGGAAAAEQGAVEVYHANLSTASDELKALHARMQPLLVFYIDAATFVDATDESWEILLAIQRTRHGIVPVGFATLYRFFAYPDRARLRCSQVLVLPPYQGRGVGEALLRGSYALARKLGTVDVTFEDPTEQMQRLRERIDLGILSANERMQAAAAKAAASLMQEPPAAANTSVPGVLRGNRAAMPLALPAADLDAVASETRLSRKQVRIVWEAVLATHPGMRTGKGQAALRKLVRARLEGSGGSAQAAAEGKRFVQLSGDSWLMAKGTVGEPVALSAVEAEEATQAEAALGAELAKRMAALMALMASLGGAEKENQAAGV